MRRPRVSAKAGHRPVATEDRRTSASQNDVFFCPAVDLAAVGTGEFGGFDLRCSPKLFFDRLTGRGEFRGGRTPHEKPFNDRPGFYLAW